MKKVLLLTVMTMALFGVELKLSGTVISDNQKMITSRYMGFVKDVRASEGDRVKKGQILYIIDSKEIDSAKSQVELAIQQAKLSLQMYQSQYTNVLLNLDRNRRLYKKDMVSKYQLETLELAEKNLKDMVDMAKKQVAQAKAKLQEVLNQYNYLKIKAPNDGVIVMKSINAGEMAMPGMPAMILTDLSKLKISAEIAESNLKDIKLNMPVSVSVPSISLNTTGKISAIIPSSNPMTHSFKIKISFDKQQKSVYPGMYSQISINAR